MGKKRKTKTQEPDFFPREATEESVLHDMVRKISDFAGDDNDGDEEDCDSDTAGSRSPFPSQRRRRRTNDHRLNPYPTVKTNNGLVADDQLSQLREHVFVWKATATATAAAAAATSATEAISDAADANSRTDADSDAAVDRASHETGRWQKENAENQTARAVERRGGSVGGGEVETIVEEGMLEDGRGKGQGLAPEGTAPSALGPLSSESSAHSSIRNTISESGDAACSNGEGQRHPSKGGDGGGSARENTGANVGNQDEARGTNANTENRDGKPKGTLKASRGVRGSATFAGTGVHERKGRRRSAAITAATAEAAKLAVRMRRLMPAAAAVAVVAGRGRGQGQGRGRGHGRPLSPGARVAKTPFFSLLSSSSAVGANARARCSPAERRAAIKPVVATTRLGDNNAPENPRTYDLDDRFLRAYLQRRFERERLPRLFAVRSGSSRHRYTVCNAFEIAKRQGARIPPVV